MIRSIGDRRTEALFRDQFVRDFQGIARSAKRKLEAIKDLKMARRNLRQWSGSRRSGPRSSLTRTMADR